MSGTDLSADRLALMRWLLQSLPAAVAYVAGPDLVFEFANDEYRRIAGGRELIGLPLREALADLPRETAEMVEQVACTGEPARGVESEVWIRRPGQEPEQLFVDVVHQAVRGGAGGVAGVLLYANDVTTHVRDRRSVEVLAERLTVTEERYRTLFETLPLGVIHYNADGTLMGANPAAAAILGLTPDTTTAWPLDRDRRAVHEDGSPFRPDELPVVIALRTGTVVANVIAGMPHWRTGELRWLRVTAVPDARDETGRPQRAYAMVTDITEQHRAEAALRESNRLLGRLRDANVVGVAVLTEHGVQEANDAYLDIIGYTRQDLESGRIHHRKITPPEYAAADENAMAQLRRTGAARPWEKEYVHRDGRRVPILVGAAVLDQHPLRWASFVVDLSARQRREQLLNAELEARVRERTAQLVRAEEARRALESELRQGERLQMVGQLTSGIAHDFSNLLGVIVGYAELAEDVSDDLDPELHRILGEIRAAADRAVHLTSDLLRAGRRAGPRPSALDLDSLITSMRDLLNVSMSGRAEVVIRPSPVPLPPVLADPGQLEQVLLNLAVNARDAMPDGGRLTICTSTIDVDEERSRDLPGTRPGRYVELVVQDNGVGMSREVRSRIFERFYTTKPEGTGTGLGLSTVRGIIAQAGGCIDVASAEGRGTAFRIYLPARGSPPASPLPRTEVT
jgi:PAS domain S-box-containing protein